MWGLGIQTVGSRSKQQIAQTPKHRIPKSPLKVNAAIVSAVRPFAPHALDDPAVQSGQAPKRLGRTGFDSGQRPMGAHLHAAVAADAAIVVKFDRAGVGRDGLCRAMTPTLAAHPAFASLDRRPLDEVPANERLKPPGPKRQRA
jgi:hypothetical protein